MRRFVAAWALGAASALSFGAGTAACAKLSGLDGLVRDDCAAGCDDGGAPARDGAPPARDGAAEDADADAAPVRGVACGEERCASCCVVGARATCVADAGCPGGVIVECDDDLQCAARFTAGGCCGASPPGAAAPEAVAALICYAGPTPCARPRCDPAAADGGCAAPSICRPVSAGAAVGACLPP